MPRGNQELDYSRWMQNLIGILQIDVTFFKGTFVFLLYFQCVILKFNFNRMGGDGPQGSCDH